MVCRRCFAHRCLHQGNRLAGAAQPAAGADSAFAPLRFAQGRSGAAAQPQTVGLRVLLLVKRSRIGESL